MAFNYFAMAHSMSEMVTKRFPFTAIFIFVKNWKSQGNSVELGGRRHCFGQKLPDQKQGLARVVEMMKGKSLDHFSGLFRRTSFCKRSSMYLEDSELPSERSLIALCPHYRKKLTASPSLSTSNDVSYKSEDCFPLGTMHFCLRVLSIDLTFISRNNTGHEVSIGFKTILQFLTN